MANAWRPCLGCLPLARTARSKLSIRRAPQLTGALPGVTMGATAEGGTITLRVSERSDMEHGRFEYSAIAKRSKLSLPNGARVAVWVVPNIEHFEYGKPAMSMTPMTAGLKPDVLNYAWRDYGARVGIWRVMEILERQGIVATPALNSDVCSPHPDI